MIYLIRFVADLFLSMGLLLVALIVNLYSHDAAVILANLWLVGSITVLTMKRQPCRYESYAEWWRDRANWWKPYPKDTGSLKGDQ